MPAGVGDALMAYFMTSNTTLSFTFVPVLPVIRASLSFTKNVFESLLFLVHRYRSELPIARITTATTRDAIPENMTEATLLLTSFHS